MKNNILFFLFLLSALGLKSQETGTFSDPRDGEVYATVKIGSQTWMAENLRYNAPGSFLNPDNPDKKYGRLYTWDQAKMACPTSWHLPSDEEWKTFEISLWLSSSKADEGEWRGKHGQLMKSQSGWNGNNSSGFNALPSGYYYAIDRSFLLFGSYAGFWSSTEDKDDYFCLTVSGSDCARIRCLDSGGPEVGRLSDTKSNGNSCRCLKD